MLKKCIGREARTGLSFTHLPDRLSSLGSKVISTSPSIPSRLRAHKVAMLSAVAWRAGSSRDCGGGGSVVGIPR